MLKLVSTSQPTVSFPMIAEQTYSIEARNGLLTFHTEEDSSKKNLQAKLIVQHPLGNEDFPKLTPTLKVIDGILYEEGIFIYSESTGLELRVTDNYQGYLEIKGQRLRIGQTREFKIEYTPLVVALFWKEATLDLQTKIRQLGGHLVKKWNKEATHIIMSASDLTKEVVCGLLAAKYIVTPAFITELRNSFSGLSQVRQLPDPTNFLPCLAAKTDGKPLYVDDMAFYPNPTRATLFKGKVFLFGNRTQLRRFSKAVQLGGGTANLIWEAAREAILSKKFIIVGEPKDIRPHKMINTARAIINVYERNNRRFVDYSEIGMAAVHNCIQEYCNPDYPFPTAN